MRKGTERLIPQPKDFQALLRQDFAAFVHRSFQELNPQTKYMHNWHIDVIAAAAEKFRARECRRLIVNQSPRSLKSHICSVALPAFILGHKPAARVICASYAQDLADNLAGSCRTLMTSKFYRELFPGTRLVSNRQAIHDFKTTKNGGRLATSVGGVLTGRGGDFIIIDDPLKPEEAFSETQRQAVNDWYDHTLVSRLDNKTTGCIMVVMQRLHEADLVGHLLAQPDWKILRFPAIAEEDEVHAIETSYGLVTYKRRKGEALHREREPLEVLAGIRSVQGPYHFAGQYQQRPSPLGGGIVKLEWFRTYTPQELPSKFELVFQSWDTANKTSDHNDYSVCTTWRISEKRLFLLDVLRDRLDYPSLRRRVKAHAQRFGETRNILIEDKASGTSLIQDLIKEDKVYATTSYQCNLSKAERMITSSSLIENGFVYLPERADWLDLYRHEFSCFPKGQYDDQVDSTSQALDWVKQEVWSFWYYEYLKEQAALINPSLGMTSRAFGSEVSPSLPSQTNTPSSVCEKCGNSNLSICCVQGISGDVLEECVCGWSRRISREQRVRTAEAICAPSFNP
jgi:predicted phage terminase large subunit-like protein